MEQHPIPQNITSYEFKLVGEMTLKQFGKAAGGIIIALLLNATKLVFFIKWPLMFIFAAGGLAMAFVPFQDRPLETWLMSFIKSIYAPTIYLWKKKINQNWLDIDLSKKLDIAKEEEENAPLPLKSKEKVEEFIQSLPSVKLESDEVLEAAAKKVEEKKKEEVKSLSDSQTVSSSEKSEQIQPKTEEKEQVEEETWRDQKANLNLQKEKLGATGQAVFGNIPMPSTPTEPNVLAGMVTDNAGKIIEEVIIEIQDSFGNPTRILKTNALGQFKASTQLANGDYLVIPEKEGYKFDRVKVTMNGQIIQPIKIRAGA